MRYSDSADGGGFQLGIDAPILSCSRAEPVEATFYSWQTLDKHL